MASNKRVILQRFTAEQARKLILGSDNRLTDNLTMMTTLVMNQKQNTFQFWKTIQMRAVVKQSEVSDLAQQKKNVGFLQDSDENISGEISGPRHMLCQFMIEIAKKIFKTRAAPKYCQTPGLLSNLGGPDCT